MGLIQSNNADIVVLRPHVSYLLADPVYDFNVPRQLEVSRNGAEIFAAVAKLQRTATICHDNAL